MEGKGYSCGRVMAPGYRNHLPGATVEGPHISYELLLIILTCLHCYCAAEVAKRRAIIHCEEKALDLQSNMAAS